MMGLDGHRIVQIALFSQDVLSQWGVKKGLVSQLEKQGMNVETLSLTLTYVITSPGSPSKHGQYNGIDHYGDVINSFWPRRSLALEE